MRKKSDSKKQSDLKKEPQPPANTNKVPAEVEKAISSYLLQGNDHKKEMAVVAGYIDKDVSHVDAICSDNEPIIVFAAIYLAAEIVVMLLNNRYGKRLSIENKCKFILYTKNSYRVRCGCS